MIKRDRPLVAGVGMIPFAKPGRSESWDVMGSTAARLAIEDAGIDYREIGQAYAGYVFCDSTAGQSALYQLGLTGVPVVNVNNNCSSGSSALFLARQAVETGATDVALALGFEQMVPGPVLPTYGDRQRTTAMLRARVEEILGPEVADMPSALRTFGGAAITYQERYGIADESLAGFVVKARDHAAHNPRAVFRDPITAAEVLASPRLLGPITRLQACPPTCGAAAAVIVSPAFAAARGLTGLVEIAGQAMTSDTTATFDDMISLVGAPITRQAAQAVYERAAAGPDDVQVVELHDCFTIAEAIFSEALGLCPEGGAEQYLLDGDNTYGGRHVVNPSGGLLAKGHPLGATGLGQCFELVTQLRGRAGDRQVDGAHHALQHNIGLGSSCVVTLYRAA